MDAAPEEEAPQPAVQLGCSKCRYSAKGCGRCRLRAGAAALVQRATNAMPSARGGSAARRAAQQALLDSAQDIWAAPPVPEEPVGPQPPTAAEMLREREEEIKNMEAACQDAAWWDPADPSKVSRAKAALHVSAAVGPGQLPLCRERQIEAVDSWLSDRLRSAQGGSLYLSGLPGTGKSLTALELARRCGRHAAAPGSKCTLPPALLAINCMRLTHPRQVVQRILAGYGTACRRQSVGPDGDDPLTLVPDEEEYIEAAAARRAGAGDIEDAKEALRRIALQQLPSWPAPSHRRASGGKGAWGEGSQRGERGMIVVVLDELDGLLSGQQGDALVGELFALAAAPRSRLVLLGIANSIDLVQQLMRPGGAFHVRVD